MRYIYSLLLAISFIAISTPGYAEFVTLQERQEELVERKERQIKQQEDTAEILKALQENNVLLKGLLLEVRKQTEVLNAISMEQQGQGMDIEKQTDLLKKLNKPAAQ